MPTSILQNVPEPLKTSYTPEEIKIAPEDTVQKRISNIISGGGPLQQVSETQALQQMQQRGLLNTSMTIGEAQKARIASAFPIASQEAQISFAAQQENQRAANQAKQFSAGFFQDIGLTRETGAQERLGITAKARAESNLMAQKADIDKKLITANADEQIRLIVQKGQLDTQLQELRGVQSIEQIKSAGEIEKSLLVQQHANLQVINRQQAQLDAKIVTQKAEISQQLLASEGALKASLLEQQGKLELELASQQGDIAGQLQNQLFDINAQLETLRANFRTEDLADQQAHELELETMQGEITKSLQDIIGSQALTLQGLKGTQSSFLTKLEGDYKLLIATQQSAAMLFTQTSSSISAILANPDIQTKAKEGLIQHELDLLSSSLALIANIGGMEFGNLLKFGGATVIAAKLEAQAELEEQAKLDLLIEEQRKKYSLR